MKKLLAIVVLGLLSSCSLDNSTKTLTNCADHIYSNKERKFLPFNFETLISFNTKYSGYTPVTDLEKDIMRLSSQGYKRSEIIRWYVELIKIKGPINKSMKYSAIGLYNANLNSIKIAKKIVADYDRDLKKFISTSLNNKLQVRSYEQYFSACETIRKRTPKTFDEKWKKPKVVYNKDL